MRTCLLLTTLLALAAAPAAAQWDQLWCNGADEITIAQHGQSYLVTHTAAVYNCCPEPIVYDLTQDGAAMVLTETVTADPPCDCDCCFELMVVVSELPPVTEELRFRWFDLESAAWSEAVLPLPSPPSGGEVPPHVSAQAGSDCIASSGIAEQPGWTWSAVKQSYR